MYNLLQMLSATNYCKIGCCPKHGKTRADTKSSRNNDDITRSCPDGIDDLLQHYNARKWCTSNGLWDSECTKTSSSCNPSADTANIGIASDPSHYSSNTATVFQTEDRQHRQAQEHVHRVTQRLLHHQEIVLHWELRHGTKDLRP